MKTMKIKFKRFLAQDLADAAKKRSITVETLIEQILSTAMLVERFLTDEDSEVIKAIYAKYLD